MSKNSTDKAIRKNEQWLLAGRILARVFQVFVAWPATALGGLALVMLVLGGSPIRDTVEGVYSWADAAVRGAPAGTVTTSTCSRPTARLPVTCVRAEGRSMPVMDAIAETERTLYGVYQGAVLLCATFMLVVMGHKRFLCMPVVAPRPGQAPHGRN